jgi:hypothetical protein
MGNYVVILNYRLGRIWKEVAVEGLRRTTSLANIPPDISTGIRSRSAENQGKREDSIIAGGPKLPV